MEDDGMRIIKWLFFILISCCICLSCSGSIGYIYRRFMAGRKTTPPVTPPIVPPVTPPVVPDDGLTLAEIALGVLVTLAADILVFFKWGKGFTAGLVKYWAKRDPKRAAKMLTTVIKKAKAGKYKK